MKKISRFYFGIDWRQWVIGIEFHKFSYGAVLEFSLLPLSLMIASREAHEFINRNNY